MELIYYLIKENFKEKELCRVEKKNKIQAAKPGWPSISGPLKKRSCEQAPKARHALLTFCTGNYKPENHTGKPIIYKNEQEH